jgi:hypothetical protein
MVLVCVWGVTHLKRWVGGFLACLVAVGTIFLWVEGLRFGAPVIAVGDAVGLMLGWRSSVRSKPAKEA